MMLYRMAGAIQVNSNSYRILCSQESLMAILTVTHTYTHTHTHTHTHNTVGQSVASIYCMLP